MASRDRKYNDDDDETIVQPSEHDKQASSKARFGYACAQNLLILLFVVLTIAELALAVRDRGVACHAVGMAQRANETATDVGQLSLVSSPS